MYKTPKIGGTYVIGCDPAEGRIRDMKSLALLDAQVPDFSVATVRDVVANEQCAVYHSLDVPGAFAKVLRLIIQMYTPKSIVVEQNGPGIAVLTKLVEWHIRGIFMEEMVEKVTGQKFHKLGWRTTKKNRDTAIRILYDDLVPEEEDPLKIYDKRTYEEFLSFQYAEDGRPEAQPGSKDDHVMAEAMASIGKKYLAKPREKVKKPFSDLPSADREVWELMNKKVQFNLDRRNEVIQEEEIFEDEPGEFI